MKKWFEPAWYAGLLRIATRRIEFAFWMLFQASEEERRVALMKRLLFALYRRCEEFEFVYKTSGERTAMKTLPRCAALFNAIREKSPDQYLELLYVVARIQHAYELKCVGREMQACVRSVEDRMLSIQAVDALISLGAYAAR